MSHLNYTRMADFMPEGSFCWSVGKGGTCCFGWPGGKVKIMTVMHYVWQLKYSINQNIYVQDTT